jgi:Tubulin like
MNTIFVIGIGGTGAKCLESFIHLCAMGMFDNHDVHVLGLDTDRQNGNYAQLQRVIAEYKSIKGSNQTVTKDSFFTAKINSYFFSPDYSRSDSDTFKNITGLTTTLDQTTKDLANAFFTKDVQEFNLLHGYRAQTHIGSMLMYHGLLDAANDPQSEIRSFVTNLHSNLANNPKVFVFGSVFGGTGASSIPIIPLALNQICNTHYNVTLEQAKFGATLLTSYFTFTSASDNAKRQEKIIADAANFAINSQAALMFYEKDETVKRTYDRFYMLGIESKKEKVSVSKSEDTPITGGANQRNDAHYMELMAAGAAYDFFNSNNNNAYQTTNNDPIYLYREVGDNSKLAFKDIINNDEFIKRITVFSALSFIVNLDSTDFFSSMQKSVYLNVTPEQVRALKSYFDYFHFKPVNDQVINGWLRSLHRSVGGNDNLFFTPKMYEQTVSGLRKFEFQEIFTDNDYKRHNFKAGMVFSGNSKDAFDKFVTVFRTKNEGQFQNPAEGLIKKMYDALVDLYKFPIAA